MKFGIKLWVLASSQSWYVSNLIVYLGAGDMQEEDELVGADAILKAVRGLEGRGYVIVTDNFFTSVKLSMTLLEHGFYATCIVKKGSKGFSSSLAGFPKQRCPKRGTLVVKMHRSHKICIVVWIDSKLVWLLSTVLDPINPNCIVPKWVKRERVDFPSPRYCSSISLACMGSTWLTRIATIIPQPYKAISGKVPPSGLVGFKVRFPNLVSLHFWS